MILDQRLKEGYSGDEGAYLRGGGGLFRLVKMVVSVFHKDLECQVEKLKYKSWRSCSRGSKTNSTFQHVNKQSRISPNEVLQS